MNKLVALGLLLCAFLGSTATMEAQKYGHLNSGNLLSQLPAVEQADKEMEAYQKQLIAKGEEMAKAFQTKLNAYMEKANAGTLSKVQEQAEQTKLQQEQQSIAKYEKEIVVKMQQKRQELLAPILQKVDAVIKAIGEEQGYDMIFDTSIINA
ncbi:MAG: OmpH family outer membrane protein, partial [Bacteroidota bacterium]